jgi:hypothetical protein
MHHVERKKSQMSESLDYQNQAVGAAIFDQSGLPGDYFVKSDGSQYIAWVQTVFQVLGMRSLLASSLKLEGFSHTLIRGKAFTALVVKQPKGYLALLFQGANLAMDANLLAWAKQLDSKQLKSNQNFRVV